MMSCFHPFPVTSMQHGAQSTQQPLAAGNSASPVPSRLLSRPPPPPQERKFRTDYTLHIYKNNIITTARYRRPGRRRPQCLPLPLPLPVLCVDSRERVL